MEAKAPTAPAVPTVLATTAAETKITVERACEETLGGSAPTAIATEPSTIPESTSYPAEEGTTFALEETASEASIPRHEPTTSESSPLPLPPPPLAPCEETINYLDVIRSGYTSTFGSQSRINYTTEGYLANALIDGDSSWTGL